MPEDGPKVVRKEPLAFGLEVLCFIRIISQKPLEFNRDLADTKYMFNFTAVALEDLTEILTKDAELFRSEMAESHEDTSILATIMVDGQPVEADLRTLSNFKLDALQLDALAHGDTDLSEAIDSILAIREI